MKIVCASSVLLGAEAFATLGDVTIAPERAIDAEWVRDADALITRSKVRMDRALLENSAVRFVGTATAGTDHMDLDYLEQRRIAWCAAPGCNANSVAEYVVAALLCLNNRHDVALEGRTVAVIGVGHVGQRVAQKVRALGMRPLLNDPPLRMATGDPAYRPLEEILPQADVVSLHVPLVENGPFPTRRLAGLRFFEQLKPGCVFINTSRGEVVDTDSLLLALEHGVVRRAVLDVFDDEPAIRPDVLHRVDIATPHIAGYSYEGKLNGTVMVYRAACQFFERTMSWSPRAYAGALPEQRVDARGLSDDEALGSIVRSAYDILADDAALREGGGVNFERLRANYPVRREFAAHRVRVENAGPALLEKLARLGFKVVS